MEKHLLSSISTTAPTRYIEADADYIKSLFATIIGTDESNLTVTFKDIDWLYHTPENLLWWGAGETEADVYGEIIIDINPDILHLSELDCYFNNNSTHYYDRSIIVNCHRMILNKENCLDLAGSGDDTYRNILPLNSCKQYLWINGLHTNATSRELFFSNQSYPDTYPDNMSVPGLEEEIDFIIDSSDTAGKEKFNNWAKKIGFDSGTVISSTTYGSYWVKIMKQTKKPSTPVPYPCLYFYGCIIIFKTKNRYKTEVKFSNNSPYVSYQTLIESDNNGQIAFSKSNTSEKISAPGLQASTGYTLSFKEINLAMDILNCYRWDNQILKDNDIVPLQGIAPPVRISIKDGKQEGFLPDDGDHIKDSEYKTYVTPQLKNHITTTLAGMVTLRNFETTAVNGITKTIRGYSYKPTRTLELYQTTEGNYVYDDSITKNSRNTLNKSKKFNFNEGYIPKIIFSKYDVNPENNKTWDSYSINVNKCTISYTDGTTDIYYLKRNDVVLKYERNPEDYESLRFQTISNTLINNYKPLAIDNMGFIISFDNKISMASNDGHILTLKYSDLNATISKYQYNKWMSLTEEEEKRYRGFLKKDVVKVDTAWIDHCGWYANTYLGAVHCIACTGNVYEGVSPWVGHYKWEIFRKIEHFTDFFPKPTLTMGSFPELAVNLQLEASTAWNSNITAEIKNKNDAVGVIEINKIGILPSSVKYGDTTVVVLSTSGTGIGSWDDIELDKNGSSKESTVTKDNQKLTTTVEYKTNSLEEPVISATFKYNYLKINVYLKFGNAFKTTINNGGTTWEGLILLTSLK